MPGWKPGFTLVEIMVALTVALIVLGPAYRVFQAGSRGSVQGMQNIELVLEGRRLIRQLHQDLKLACRSLPSAAAPLSFADLLKITPGPDGKPAGTRYTFFVFPAHGEIEQICSAGGQTGSGSGTGASASPGANSGQGVAPRLLARITYVLEAQPGSRLLKLTREERLPAALGGNTNRSVLSERVNYLSLQPREIATTAQRRNQWLFNVFLQLAEIQPGSAAAAAGAATSGNAGQLLVAGRENGVTIFEFFDLVYPEFFNALWNQEFINRNWHTPLQAPD